MGYIFKWSCISVPKKLKLSLLPNAVVSRAMARRYLQFDIKVFYQSFKVIESVVSRAMARRYLQFDIKVFNQSFKVIESVVSRAMARRYLQFDIKVFNQSFKVIESVVSRAMARRYLQFDIKVFNQSFKVIESVVSRAMARRYLQFDIKVFNQSFKVIESVVSRAIRRYLQFDIKVFYQSFKVIESVVSRAMDQSFKVIESVVSRAMARRYLQFDIKVFYQSFKVIESVVSRAMARRYLQFDIKVIESVVSRAMVVRYLQFDIKVFNQSFKVIEKALCLRAMARRYLQFDIKVIESVVSRAMAREIPQFDIKVIESVVSRAMARRYLQFDIKVFKSIIYRECLELWPGDTYSLISRVIIGDTYGRISRHSINYLGAERVLCLFMARRYLQFDISYQSFKVIESVVSRAMARRYLQFDIQGYREVVSRAMARDTHSLISRYSINYRKVIESVVLQSYGQRYLQFDIKVIERGQVYGYLFDIKVFNQSFKVIESVVSRAMARRYLFDIKVIERVLCLELWPGDTYSLISSFNQSFKVIESVQSIILKVIESVVSRAMARRYLQFDIKVIESVVSRAMARRYLQFDIKVFNQSFKVIESVVSRAMARDTYSLIPSYGQRYLQFDIKVFNQTFKVIESVVSRAMARRYLQFDIKVFCQSFKVIESVVSRAMARRYLQFDIKVFCQSFKVIESVVSRAMARRYLQFDIKVFCQSFKVIESVVSRAMARRYLQFDIKVFYQSFKVIESVVSRAMARDIYSLVESNPNIKWCPFPGCGQAVKMPETYIKLPSDTSKAVDCGKGHLFCWECLGEAHEPASCENWKKWYNKIAEIRPKNVSYLPCNKWGNNCLRTTEEETENAANCLWLVTNSKSCPNCKSPIQKNEGCNHMKCCKCKYDFCWVCLDPWKRHNSSTGGYFKCNRYEAVKVVNEKVNKAQNELEEPLLSTTKNKMMKLAEAVTDIATANAETKFVEDAVHQLLKARRVLKCSYVYGYYLDGPGYKKIVFEFMQTELEECTEILSQMVNRLYLRTPRKRIIEQAQIVQRKRQEFLSAIMKGLVPPETPPGLRKQRRRKYSMDFEDDELRSAVLASIQDVDPANPWIKDASGRHTNVTAMLDWPDSDDSDTDVTTIIKLHGTCLRKGCSRTRVKNPRTGDWHEYCSRACMQADQIQASQEQEESQAEVVVDEQMDLLRALEMSRLLYLQEQGILFDQQSRDSVLIGAQTPEESEDKKLKYIVTTQDEQRSTELGILSKVFRIELLRMSTIVTVLTCRTVQKLLADTGIGDLDLGPEYMLDLETSDHTNNMPDELLGACAAEVSPDHGHQSSPANGISNDLTILDFDGASTNNKTFGIIKNLSVSNIDFGEDNKAKNFSTKPKITNTIANNTGELLPKTSNICWSNLSRQRKQSNHDRQYMELELADQASGGHAEDLSIKPTQENQNDFDLQLSLKQFMNELTLHGCEEFENKPSEDQEYKTRETTNLDLPMLNVKGDNSDLSLDLDMSVKSGYDPSIKLSSDEPGPNHTTDLELTTDPVLTADLKITSDLEFDDDMHEAETLKLKIFRKINNLPSPGASVDPSLLHQTDDASRRDSTVESVNETGDDSNIQNSSGMEENDCDDKSTFV
ncbi:ANKIB1 [Mytilus edulis]|uniref:RBR-type E3 ubiquitin transferase n=1 Tax=Mytilus edulis TaxID=6550 RepID=A0A8S3S5Q4_MYTED|nr:ANKIB1 [Mytilus edulis]